MIVGRHEYSKFKSEEKQGLFDIFGSEKFKNLTWLAFKVWIAFLLLSDMWIFTQVFQFKTGHYVEYILLNINSASILYLAGVSLIPFVFIGIIYTISAGSFKSFEFLLEKIPKLCRANHINSTTNKTGSFVEYHINIIIIVLMIILLVILIISMPIYSDSFEKLVLALLLSSFLLTILLFSISNIKPKSTLVSLVFIVGYFVIWAVVIYIIGQYIELEIAKFLFFSHSIALPAFFLSPHYSNQYKLQNKPVKASNMIIFMATFMIIVFLFFSSDNRAAWETEWQKGNRDNFALFFNKRMIVDFDDENLEISISKQQISKLDKNVLRDTFREIDANKKTITFKQNTGIKKLTISDTLVCYFIPLKNAQTEVFIVKTRDLYGYCEKCYELLGYSIF